ncbi:hypothetical protein [Streptomyces sp. NPDC050145]|uniref:SCO2400 family protein n=1 Tax=Streptomyces sp. NPDC050145 TaxID=3365602 RepID=UPI0037A12785
MDYCHPCRRHLNGAVTCPGCGTPAEAVHAYAEALAAQEAVEETAAEPEEAPLRPRGRRRRSTRARTQRRRRRRVLFVAAGLALAAGGLGVAELSDSGPPADTQAAPDVTGAEETGTGSTRPAEPSQGSTPPASATGGPTASASPSASRAHPDAEKSPSKEPEKKESRSPAGADTPATSTPPQAPSTARPTTSAPRPTSAPPAPAPAPTETCDRFLWWCT